MPPRTGVAERIRAISPEAPKFKTPEDELIYLREKIKQKEKEMDVKDALGSSSTTSSRGLAPVLTGVGCAQ